MNPVHVVGAGPGAADLLTLRAVELLRRADVVLYPGTYLDAAVLGHCRDGARLVDTAGLDIDAILGEVLAAAVNLANPALVAIGGDLVGAFDPLVAGVREAIYRRSMAAATQNLRIEPGLLSGRSGVMGCAILVLDEVLSPGSVDAALSA